MAGLIHWELQRDLVAVHGILYGQKLIQRVQYRLQQKLLLLIMQMLVLQIFKSAGFSQVIHTILITGTLMISNYLFHLHMM